VRKLIAATVVLLPLITTSGGIDNFRQPKDSLLIAAASVLLAIAAITFVVRPFQIKMTRELMLIGAALAWTLVCTLTSTNRTLSAMSLVWLLSLLVFGLATAALAKEESLTVILLPLGVAAINAAIFLLQRFEIWNPITFTDDIAPHFRYTALIGNPDDAASFFVAPTVVAIAFIASTRGWRRAVAAIALTLLVAALVTGRLTGIVAATAGAAAFFIIRYRKRGIAAVAALIAIVIVVGLAWAPLRTRVGQIVGQIRAGDYAEATSGRVTPFLAAAAMTKDHMITGVGPSCFAWEYFPYKARIERRFPQLASAWAHSFVFRDVHNDHLELLAECGVIGYALVLAAIIAIVRATWRGENAFAAMAILPLAISLAVLCLAHFPLHLSAPALMFVYFGALMWGSSGGQAPSPVRTGEAPVLHWTLRAVLAAFIVSASAYAIYRFAYFPYSCETMTREISARTDAAEKAPEYAGAPMARRNLERLAPCVRRVQEDMSIYMLAAANHHILGQLAEARAMEETALRYQRRPELYYALGRLQLEAGDRAAALESLYHAVQFSREYLGELPADVVADLTARLQRDDSHLAGR